MHAGRGGGAGAEGGGGVRVGSGGDEAEGLGRGGRSVVEEEEEGGRDSPFSSRGDGGLVVM